MTERGVTEGNLGSDPRGGPHMPDPLSSLAPERCAFLAALRPALALCRQQLAPTAAHMLLPPKHHRDRIIRR